MELGNSPVALKVNALIAKYKEASQTVINLQEKIISLESACAQKDAKISELEEEILTRTINDDELIKNIEQVMGIEQ